MEEKDITALVDGREVVLPRAGMTGRAVLAAVGADPERRDVLICDDGGHARLIAPADAIEITGETQPTFRVHRNGAVRHVKIDGRAWEWGSGAIREDEIREIAGLPDDVGLFLANGGGEPLRRGAFVDLTADWVPSIVSHAIAPERATVPVVVNGKSRELISREVSFEDLVGLAFPERADLTQGMFTVTYRQGPADRPEGSLVPSQSIRATQGTVINVTATDKS